MIYIMEAIYYSKYIKYKTKYINLRETQKGGGFLSNLFSSKTSHSSSSKTSPRFSSKTSSSNLNKEEQARQIQEWLWKQLLSKDKLILTEINAKKEVLSKKINQCPKSIIPDGMLAKLDILISNIEVNINGKKYLLTMGEKEEGEISADVTLQMAYKRWHEKLWNMKHLLDNLEKTIELCNISDLEKVGFQIDKLWNE